MKRPLAFALAFLIIALSPGLPAYQAFAQATSQSGSAASGSVGDAASSVNSNLGGGAVTPLKMDVHSLGLSGAVSPSASIATVQPMSGVVPTAGVVNAGVSAKTGVVPTALGVSVVPASSKEVPGIKSGVPAALKPVALGATPSGGRIGAASKHDGPLVFRGADGRLTEQVKTMLDEAGEKLAKPGADHDAIINELYEKGITREQLDSLVGDRNYVELGPGVLGLSQKSHVTLSAHDAKQKSLPLAPAVEEAAKTAAFYEKAYANNAAPNGKSVPVAQKPVPAKPTLWQKLKSNFDLSEFNKSEKAYIAGQAVFLFAISVYLASLPLLVKALTGDAAMTGVARMVHYWVFGGVSLFAGAVVGKNPMKRILVGAATGRALLFGSIGALALFGALPWTAFLVLVGVNSMLVAHNHLVDIDTGGAAKIFKGSDQASTDHKIEKAGYVYDFIYYGMMLVVPALIGLPMDWLDARFGPGIGAAAGFSLFAGLMALVSYIYSKHVVVIGDAVTAPLKGVRDFLGRAVSALRTFGRILLDIPRRNWATFKIILGNKAILARWTMATMENFVEDALFAVVLPTYAIDILKMGAFGNGLLLSAITAGGLVASVFLMKRIQALQQKYGTYKVLAGLTAIAALAFIPSIGLWVAPSIFVAIPAVFMMKLMLQPLRSRMRALLQTEIKNDPKAAPYADDIYSLMTTAEVLAAGAGGFGFSWLVHHSVPGTALGRVLGAFAPMKIITGTLFAMGFVYMGGLRWVKAQLNKPTYKTYKSPEGNEARMLERLKTSLEENEAPPYTTEIVAGPAPENEPIVAILAPPSRHKVAMALEGGRQEAGAVHLVSDASWLIQEVFPDGRTKLLMKKGIVFDEKGRARVVEYETPRRVGYFADFFTLGANDRDDGVPFEKNLDVPQSNSLALEKLVNDKLRTRLMLAAVGVPVPATLALLMPDHPLNDSVQATHGRVQFAAMPSEAAREAEIARLVDEYLAGFDGQELVVKPSGPQFHSGRGVKFFKRTERDAIVAHAVALSKDEQMTSDGAVLLDERVNSAPLDRGGRKMETTARVLVARTPWGGAKTSDMFARVGPWGKPTTAEAADPRDNATVEPMETLFAEWKSKGLLDERGVAELKAQMQEIGEKALEAIMQYETQYMNSNWRKDGDPYQAQTDLIGLDVMIENRGGKLVPVIIEINDHDSGGQFNLDRMHPDRQGEHSREWVATMLQRARREVLKDKRVVLVGAGYAGKRFIFERAKKLGVEIVLVDKKTPFVQQLIKEKLVSDLIETDNTKPAKALADARKKLQRSIKKNGKIDGITSFWEDDVPLTADLAAALGLPYHTQDAAKSVRSKAETRKVMEKAGLPTPRNRKVPSLATVSDRGAAVKAFKDAMAHVGYPSVMKPAFGAAAMGVKRVDNLEQAVAAYEELSAIIDPKNDEIFNQGTDIVIEQYLDGREWDVDLVMKDGKAVYSSVTDNWPTREPYFLATGSSLPSRRLSKKEQRESIDLAIKTAQALGLTDGVIHIEGKYTKDGARIIEANGRMGGEYVRDWNLAVNGVDLVEEGLMVAAKVGGKPYTAPKPITYLEGEFIIPTESGVVEAFDLPESARLMQGFHELRVKKAVGDRIAVPPVGYERMGMLVARGKDADEAQKNLDAVRANLSLKIKK